MLYAEGKAGSLVDEKGHFYKPVQVRVERMNLHQPCQTATFVQLCMTLLAAAADADSASLVHLSDRWGANYKSAPCPSASACLSRKFLLCIASISFFNPILHAEWASWPTRAGLL